MNSTSTLNHAPTTAPRTSVPASAAAPMVESDLQIAA